MKLKTDCFESLNFSMFKLVRMLSVLMKFNISLAVSTLASGVFGAESSWKCFYFKVCWDYAIWYYFVRAGCWKGGCQSAESLYQSNSKKKLCYDYGYSLKH